MRKKIVSLAMAAAMMAVSVTGCSGNSNLTGEEIVAEFGDTQISAGVAEFFARYQQAQYETYYMSYYGEDMWSMAVDDTTTYEDSVKSSVLKSLESMYVLESHMNDYNVSFTLLPDLKDEWIGANNHPNVLSHTAAANTLTESINAILK